MTPKNGAQVLPPVRAADGPDPAKTLTVSRMFGRIARKYDLVNRLMSGGRDEAWRAFAARLAAGPKPGLALDVATGTGDLALALQRTGCRVVGLDPCAEMVGFGLDKTSARSVSFTLGDAHSLPFHGEAFDCVTVAFGVRNMADPVSAFQEMGRVLRPEGRVACLEIMPPAPGFVGSCYGLYLNRFVPWLGGLISGQPDAYRYFSNSVMHFQDPESLKAIMEAAGLTHVTYYLMHLKTIAIHVGVRG
jgi:demethylmenaquinone methyltransferase/2-methoxy-6-polyprenyl-1,4-benzoquinol methylase